MSTTASNTITTTTNTPPPPAVGPPTGGGGISGTFYAASSGTPEASRMASSGAVSVVVTGDQGCSGTLKLYILSSASYLANNGTSVTLAAYVAGLTADLTLTVTAGQETTGGLTKIAGSYLVGVLTASAGRALLSEVSA